jgi:hypothetical protein
MRCSIVLDKAVTKTFQRGADMNITSVRQTAIMRVITVGLVGLCGLAATSASAQRSDGVVILTSSIPAGMGRAQTLRVSLANLIEGSDVESIRARATFVFATGEPIIHIEAPPVLPGQTHSFDFVRDAIGLTGEEGTGRLQGRVEIEVFVPAMSKRVVEAINRQPRQFLPASLEVLENGRTVDVGNLELTVKILN